MERGEKIYTFIMPEIEVPPVIMKSTVGSERLERLIMLSTARNLFRFVLFSVQIGLHLPPRRPLFSLYPRRAGFCSAAASVPSPLDSHAPARPCDGGQTASPSNPKVPSRGPCRALGAILCAFFPFYKSTVIKKNFCHRDTLRLQWSQCTATRGKGNGKKKIIKKVQIKSNIQQRKQNKVNPLPEKKPCSLLNRYWRRPADV